MIDAVAHWRIRPDLNVEELTVDEKSAYGLSVEEDAEVSYEHAALVPEMSEVRDGFPARAEVQGVRHPGVLHRAGHKVYRLSDARLL